MKNPYSSLKTSKARRALLKKLSVSAKARAKALGVKTNDVLIADYGVSYQGKKKLEFHSFKEWGKLGYKVTKGKSYLVWSDPIPSSKEDGKYFFVPAHVWSSLDVVKMTSAEKAKYQVK